MKYSIEMILPTTAMMAYRQYLDHEAMLIWEKGLVAIEDVEGHLFEEKSKGFLVFQVGTQSMRMGVEVEQLALNSRATLIYTLPGAWNHCINHFVDHEEGCLWTMDVEFRFEGEPPAEREQFIAQTTIGMESYKKYWEKRQ